METVLRFEEYPDHTLTVLLFKNVTNCGYMSLRYAASAQHGSQQSYMLCCFCMQGDPATSGLRVA